MTNHYRRFVKGYAKITASLTELLKKDFRFLWTGKEQAPFETFKKALTSAPVLIIPNTKESFRLDVDISYQAIGAVLSQQEGNCWKPVAFESKRLKAAAKYYPIHEIELLALIHALNECRYYLYGQDFSAYTDHKSLTHLFAQAKLSVRQARWLELLQDYGDKPGSKNMIADSFPRRPDMAMITQSHLLKSNHLI